MIYCDSVDYDILDSVDYDIHRPHPNNRCCTWCSENIYMCVNCTVTILVTVSLLTVLIVLKGL